MYQCPNCGGNLLFDISSQQLKCEYCLTQVDPYSIQKEHDAEENTLYDAVIYTCPQCGGEIIGPENSAAEFCSYCGASTILTGRLVKEKRPGYIIPFQITKEDCVKSYKSIVRRAIFAPKELKDPKFINRFRGIYMPYWAYYIAQDGSLNLSGSTSHRSGDYIVTDHYKLNGILHSYYKGLSYDASSTFNDNISEAIAPFDPREMKAFTPSILSGFYADTADVDSAVYMPDAYDFANDNTLKQISRTPQYFGVDIKTPTTNNSLNSQLHTLCKEVDSAMYPVWFLSYRRGNRVAYATVNGQTGKAVADLPVSVGKYLLVSLILALPIFLLLCVLFTFKPTTTLSLSAILSAVTIIIHSVELSQIKKRELHEGDLGLISTRRSNATLTKNRVKTKNKTASNIIGIIFACVFGTFFAIFTFAALGNLMGRFIVPALSMICGIVATAIGSSSTKKLKKQLRASALTPSLFALIIAFLVRLINPVSDVFYYGATIIIFISTIITLVDIIQKYNILSTRKLPQFSRKGSDKE